MEVGVGQDDRQQRKLKELRDGAQCDSLYFAVRTQNLVPFWVTSNRHCRPYRRGDLQFPTTFDPPSNADRRHCILNVTAGLPRQYSQIFCDERAARDKIDIY